MLESEGILNRERAVDQLQNVVVTAMPKYSFVERRRRCSCWLAFEGLVQPCRLDRERHSDWQCLKLELRYDAADDFREAL